MALGQGPEDSEKKCLASNSEHELYLKTFNEDSPHQDTIFLITEVLG